MEIKSLLKKSEFIRFCIVGVVCTGIDSAIFYTFLQFSPYQVALVAGYLLSLVANYFLTIYWTFKKKANLKNAIGIVAAHLFNLFVVRMGLMFVFVSCLSWNDCIAYWPTLVISVIINFIIVRLVVDKLG